MSSEEQSAPAPTGVRGDDWRDASAALGLLFVAGIGVVVLVLLTRRRRKTPER